MIEIRACRVCGKEKPISDFYKHKYGHLWTCKDCYKGKVSDRIKEKSKDLNWLNKERLRGREKYHRLGYKSKKMHHPETKSVTVYFRTRGIQLQGCEYHHWNYNFLHDVIVVPIGTHRKLHNLLVYDDESKCFLHNGRLLTTKQDHINLIKSIS